jgi:hypothetical protein
MDPYKELANMVGQLPLRARVAFVASCADRIVPLFRFFRGGTRPDALEVAIEEVWECLDRDDLAAINPICLTLQVLPEADVEGDSNIREYYASWAIGIFKHVADSTSGPHPGEGILKVIYYALGLADNIDGALDPNGSGDGPIRLQEEAAQQACYRLLAEHPNGPLPITELRRLSADVAGAYIEAAPRVAAYHRWGLAS